MSKLVITNGVDVSGETKTGINIPLPENSRTVLEKRKS